MYPYHLWKAEIYAHFIADYAQSTQKLASYYGQSNYGQTQ